ncbi:MAG: hypothetical protein DKT66_13270 [Candidatus Melainabacteria bacterium]|nr:MAG: hypothetical protein DKT66_13270 [Candidatus Melainabacteria bacterium]
MALCGAAIEADMIAPTANDVRIPLCICSAPESKREGESTTSLKYLPGGKFEHIFAVSLDSRLKVKWCHRS